jgi:Domain of unknown function (DUF4265)
MIKTKIFFLHDNAFEGGSGVESAWASLTPEGNFRLDNILFYAKGFSFGDIVSAKLIKDECIVTGLIKESGHSTIRLLFKNIKSIVKTRKLLLGLGCQSEISDLPQLISVDIPPHINYDAVKTVILEGEKTNKWFYEEACIAHNN